MMKSIDIVYLRVSKTDEKEQDLDSQKEAIIHKFKLHDPIIYQERGSAYVLEKVKKRTEFIKILNLLFNNKGITDIFLQDFEPKQINLYIWDLNRIMRNLKFNLLFSLIASIYEVKIYSYGDKEINRKPENTDDEFILLLLATLSAKKAEDYSNDISKNTKKSFMKVKNSSYSKKDKKKIGRKFTKEDGTKVILTPSQEDIMVSFIEDMIINYEKRNMCNYYPLIIKQVQLKFDIFLSPAYLSNIRKRVLSNV